jgi:23S rRNA (cytosine1962-C5)-methyltransferase
MQAPVLWRLRAGADRRFRSGHPWVYSNELQESPKGLEPGAEVLLQDPAGQTIARGYGNPHSLISFRAVSRDANETDALEVEGIVRRLMEAARLRAVVGLGEVSHRLCFGEADRLPGLIIDRYVLAGEPVRQLYVVQAHTAGMNRRLSEVFRALESVAATQGPGWDRTGIVVRNDVAIRKLEGLTEEPSRVERAIAGLSNESLRDASIRLMAAEGAGVVEFRCDLLEGQKTGFFLDQSLDVALAARALGNWAGASGVRAVKLLDLCSYVGQWSTQLARALRARGLEVEVTVVDASAPALEFARRNVEAQGARVETVRGDVLRDLASMPEGAYDLVICDPPALIKGRKDIPAGTHAYLQLNTQAFRLLRRGGAIVSCSCSALLEESEFMRVLSKAAYRNRRRVRWVARGGQGPDHPVLAEFPEGRYLKAFIGVTENG